MMERKTEEKKKRLPVKVRKECQRSKARQLKDKHVKEEGRWKRRKEQSRGTEGLRISEGY